MHNSFLADDSCFGKQVFRLGLLLSIILLITIAMIDYYFPQYLHNTLKGHSDDITCVAFAPDGKNIATGSRDCTARLWNLTSGREKVLILEHKSAVQCLSFSADSNSLATAGLDGLINIWKIPTGEKYMTLPGHFPKSTRAVAFATNGIILASGGEDGIVSLWNILKRSKIRDINGHRSLVSCLVFSPNAALLASCGTDGIIIWDANKWAEYRRIEPFDSYSYSYIAAFSPDGITLASNGLDNIRLNNIVKLTDVKTGVGEKMLKADMDWPICSLAFSPDGSILAGSNVMGPTVRFWNTFTGQLVSKRYLGSTRALAFSPDGKYLATGGREGLVKLWDVASLFNR